MTPFPAGRRLTIDSCAIGVRRDAWIGGAQMTVGVACRSCGTDLREKARFCDGCGAPTAVHADVAEYKQVTVLFADVVRSMGIAATLDVERLRFLLASRDRRHAHVDALHERVGCRRCREATR